VIPAILAEAIIAAEAIILAEAIIAAIFSGSYC